MRTTMSRRFWQFLWAGFAGLLYFYVRTLDGAAILAVLRGAKGGWLALAVGCNFVLVLLKGQRLLILLRDVPTRDPRLSGLRLSGFYLAGYAADNLLFGQAGIGLRVFLLRGAGVKVATAIGSQVLDKILEAAGLGVLWGLSWAVTGQGGLPKMSSLPSRVGPTAGPRWVVGAGAALLGGVGVLAWRRSGRFRGTVGAVVKRALVAARPLRSPRAAAKVAALTLLCWGVELLMVRWVVAGLGATLSVEQGVLVLVLGALALLIPGLPANIGPFEAAVTVGLGAAGLPAVKALPAAVLYHLIHTVPATLLGLPGLQKGISSFRRSPPAGDEGPPG